VLTREERSESKIVALVDRWAQNETCRQAEDVVGGEV
jgi:hypothetical protein